MTATELGTPFDIAAVRAQFPVLAREVHGEPLVYLDSAASAQKPLAVIERVQRYYAEEHSNVHRGVHLLSQEATDAYEAARTTTQRFINAPSPEEVILTKGTTDAINLVAATYGAQHVGAGDSVVITTLEHHSNIVPWQMLCERTGAHLRVVPVFDDGTLDLDAYHAILAEHGERIKIVAANHVSNALGTINPIADMAEAAHAVGAVFLADGAQAMPHVAVDMQALGVDFYALSAHKVYGPTGTGALFGRRELLDAMPPYQGGGDMIDEVSFEGTTFAEVPHKFEAGTPNIAGVIGMGAALEWLTETGREAAEAYEAELLARATERLEAVPGLRLVGTAPQKASVLSFVLDGIHPYDAGTVLDRLGIAVRTGHHCTQPLMKRLGLPGTIRASLAVYSDDSDVDALISGLNRVNQMFG